MSFDSGLRELLINGVDKNDTHLTFLISAIKSLISKYAPKEKDFGKDFDEDSNCDFNYVKGWNDYKAKLFKELNIMGRL